MAHRMIPPGPRNTAIIDGDIAEAALALGVDPDDLTLQMWEYDEPTGLMTRTVANGGTVTGASPGGIADLQSNTTAGDSYAYVQPAYGDGFAPIRGRWYMAMRVKFPSALAATSKALAGFVNGTPFHNLGIGADGADPTQLKLMRYNSSFPTVGGTLLASQNLGVLVSQVAGWTILEMKSDGVNFFGRVRGLTGWVQGEAVTGIADGRGTSRDGVFDSGTGNARMVIDKKIIAIRTSDIP